MRYLEVFVAAGLVAIAVATWAKPPVPFYDANVARIDKPSPGSAVIVTQDSPEAVGAWYRKNLAEATGEHKTEDGVVIFHTRSGATVAVEPGNRFEPNTRIGLVWEAKKFGTYAGK